MLFGRTLSIFILQTPLISSHFCPADTPYTYIQDAPVNSAASAGLPHFDSPYGAPRYADSDTAGVISRTDTLEKRIEPLDEHRSDMHPQNACPVYGGMPAKSKKRRCDRKPMKGDRVTIRLRSYVDESLMDLWRKLHQDAGLASDALPRHVTTTQTFQIGKHSIPGVDQAVMRLCEGETRKLGAEAYGVSLTYAVKLVKLHRRPGR